MTNDVVPRRVLVVLRVYVGLVFLAAGVGQLLGTSDWVQPGQSWGAGLGALLVRWSAHVRPFYHGLLTGWIIPHADRLAPVVAVMNVVIGAALIAGAFTRAVAAVAIFLMANCLAANGRNPVMESAQAMYLSLALAILLGNAGLVAGIDGLRAAKAGVPEATRAAMPRWAVVPLRIQLGLALLDPGNIKFGANWKGWVAWMPGFIQEQMKIDTPLIHPWLSHVVLPHAALFAGIVAVAEPVIGAAMVLGFAVRLFGALGALLTLNYFLLNGQEVWSVSNDLCLALGFATVAVLSAGRWLGVDGWLARKWPGARVW